MPDVSSRVYGLLVSVILAVALVTIFSLVFRLLIELMRVTVEIEVPAPPSDTADGAEDRGGLSDERGQRIVRQTLSQFALPDVRMMLFMIIPFLLLAALFIGILQSDLSRSIFPMVFPTDDGSGAGVRTWVEISKTMEKAIWDLMRRITRISLFNTP